MNRQSNGVLIQLSVAAVMVAALCVAGVVYVAGTFDTRFGVAPSARRAAPPGNHAREAPISAPAAQSPAEHTKKLVRDWMAENFADPHFEEVRWWVGSDGVAAVLRVRFKGPLGGPLIKTLGFSKSGKGGSVQPDLEIDAIVDYGDSQKIVDSWRQHLADEAAESTKMCRLREQIEAERSAENPAPD
jgi:hypothetical protein